MSGMDESRFVLDTNAIIFLTTRNNTISNELRETLDGADLFTSVIVEMELFAKQDLLQEEEGWLRSFLADRVPVVDLNDAIKKETIALRRSTKIKLPDCIIVATSIIMDAVLLTHDDRLIYLGNKGMFILNRSVIEGYITKTEEARARNEAAAEAKRKAASEGVKF
jgi:predicted nucleic acid-binding protein